MFVNTGFNIKIFLFTSTKFFLQFSSLVFLIILLLISEKLFDQTQYLTNFSNLLSYPAIALSTLIVVFQEFFKNFYYYYYDLIKKTVITCLI